MRTATSHLILAALAMVPACRRAPEAPPAADPNQVVATWSGGMIRRSDIQAGYASRLAGEPGATPERQAELLRVTLERRARVEMLYREAETAGLPERADVKTTLRAQADRVLADDWLNEHVAKQAAAAAAQVEAEVARRAANPGAETRRFAHIFLRAPKGDAAARTRADATMAEVRRALAAGTSFEELARKHSDSITARGGGQVEWTTRAVLHPAAAAVVFALSEGQVSDVVETEAGLQIFRLDGIRRPLAADPEALRAEVKRSLDAEAAGAAVAAARQRAWDESGITLDERALARAPRPGEVVATVAGEALTRVELDHAKESWTAWSGQAKAGAVAEVARTLVVDRLLAAKRRVAPIDAALQKRLDDARRALVVDIRRLQLIGTVPTDVTADEIAAFYEQQRDTAPMLRDHVIDLLFFAQKGPAAAGVYALGERVSKDLRDGKTFDEVLAAPPRGALVSRRLSAGDLDSLRGQSNRLYRELSRLTPGEVSAPVYIDGDRVSFTGTRPVIAANGLAFVRLLEVRPLPLPHVSDRIRAALVQQKQSAGVAAFQEQLNARAQLRILVDRL